ncbi:MAG: hypothetical protein H6718_20970 [Polyangiaceae bacterium]|nr:hypothetical protein [Polyangiaceae bacterium]MCB9608839.1 hypothetical protein [Polyangiaceae bacterium]
MASIALVVGTLVFPDGNASQWLSTSCEGRAPKGLPPEFEAGAAPPTVHGMLSALLQVSPSDEHPQQLLYRADQVWIRASMSQDQLLLRGAALANAVKQAAKLNANGEVQLCVLPGFDVALRLIAARGKFSIKHANADAALLTDAAGFAGPFEIAGAATELPQAPAPQRKPVRSVKPLPKKRAAGPAATHLAELPSSLVEHFGLSECASEDEGGLRLDLSHSALTLDDVAELLRLPELASLRVTELDLGAERLLTKRVPASRFRFGDAGAQYLAELPELSCVERLRLADVALTDTGLAALASSPHFANVHTLDLSGAQLSGEGLTRLFSSPLGERLEHLLLNGATLSEAAVAALGEARALRKLSLAYCPIGDAGLSAFAENADSSRIVELGLFNTGIGRAGALALAEAPLFARLEALSVAGNPQLDEVSGEAFAAAGEASALRTLCVERSVGLEAALPALVGAFPRLAWFHAGTAYSDELVSALGRRTWQQPELIWCGGCPTDSIAIALVRHPGLAGLRFLTLQNAAFSVVQAIAEAKHLESLERLQIKCHDANVLKMQAAFAERRGFRKLRLNDAYDRPMIAGWR